MTLKEQILESKDMIKHPADLRQKFIDYGANEIDSNGRKEIQLNFKYLDYYLNKPEFHNMIFSFRFDHMNHLIVSTRRIEKIS